MNGTTPAGHPAALCRRVASPRLSRRSDSDRRSAERLPGSQRTPNLCSADTVHAPEHPRLMQCHALRAAGDQPLRCERARLADVRSVRQAVTRCGMGLSTARAVGSQWAFRLSRPPSVLRRPSRSWIRELTLGRSRTVENPASKAIVSMFSRGRRNALDLSRSVKMAVWLTHRDPSATSSRFAGAPSFSQLVSRGSLHSPFGIV